MSLIIPNKFECILAQRELRSIFYLAGYYLCAAFLVGVTIVSTIIEIKSLSRLEAMSSEFSQLMMICYFGALIVGTFIIVPPIGVIITTVERDRNCLDLLMMTPAFLSEIFNAKVLAVLAFYLITVIATLPVIGVVFFFVGVEWELFLSMLGCSLLLVVGCANVGVSTGAKYANSSHAVLMAYGKTLLFIYLLPIFLFGLLIPGILVNFTDIPRNIVFFVQFLIAPILYILGAVRSCRRQAVIALQKDPRNKTPNIFFDTEANPIGHRFVPKKYLTKAELRPRGRQMATAEQQRNFEAAQILFTAIPIFIVFCVSFAFLRKDTLINIWCAMYMFPYAILLPVIIGTKLSREHEQRTFSQLRMTLISPSGLVLGDLVNTAISFCFYFIIPPIGLAAIAIREFEGLLTIWSTSLSIIGILLYFLLVLTGCQVGSLLFRRSLWAVLAAYIISIVITCLCWPISKLNLRELAIMMGSILIFFCASLWLMRHNHYKRAVSGEA